MEIALDHALVVEMSHKGGQIGGESPLGFGFKRWVNVLHKLQEGLGRGDLSGDQHIPFENTDVALTAVPQNLGDRYPALSKLQIDGAFTAGIAARQAFTDGPEAPIFNLFHIDPGGEAAYPTPDRGLNRIGNMMCCGRQLVEPGTSIG